MLRVRAGLVQQGAGMGVIPGGHGVPQGRPDAIPSKGFATSVITRRGASPRAGRDMGLRRMVRWICDPSLQPSHYTRHAIGQRKIMLTI
jgi:hypothetical protein